MVAIIVCLWVLYQNSSFSTNIRFMSIREGFFGGPLRFYDREGPYFHCLEPWKGIFPYLVCQNSSFLWIVNIAHRNAGALVGRKAAYSAIIVGLAKSISRKIICIRPVAAGQMKWSNYWSARALGIRDKALKKNYAENKYRKSE